MDGNNTPGTQAPNDDTQQTTPGAGNGAQGGSGEPQGGAGNGDQGGEPTVDYRKKYDEAISHSREWEKRAKANKAAAVELEKLKESQKTEAEKQAERLAELEAENAEFKAREDRAKWAAEVADESGVPANLLRGSTREELEAHADELKPHFASGDGAGNGAGGAQASSADQATAQAFSQSPQGGPQSVRQQIDAAVKAGDYDLAANLKASMLGVSN